MLRIPEQLVQAIPKLYEGIRARALQPDEETEFFSILAGLFAIIIDYVMRSSFNGREAELGFQLHQRKCRRVLATYLSTLDFVDDIALVSTELLEAKELLHRVDNEVVTIGFHANAKKRK